MHVHALMVQGQACVAGCVYMFVFDREISIQVSINSSIYRNGSGNHILGIFFSFFTDK